MSSGRVIVITMITMIMSSLPLLGVASSCARVDDEDDSEQLADVLAACGVLTPGQPPAIVTSTDPFQSCILQCAAEGTCSQLEGLLCSEGGGGPLLETCTAQCIEIHGHPCGGQTISPEHVCDGIDDCSDASDELDCPPPFTCDDGHQLAPRLQCDGVSDCFDASDEIGCPAGASVACTDGTQIPATTTCDGMPDCPDGSDEVGCAMIVCPDADVGK